MPALVCCRRLFSNSLNYFCCTAGDDHVNENTNHQIKDQKNLDELNKESNELVCNTATGDFSSQPVNKSNDLLNGGTNSDAKASSSKTGSKTVPRKYKLVVLGEGGVGKSALTLQFVTHSFPEYHDPTIEDSYQQQAVIDGEPALLDILDTAGQVEFTAMRDQYMRCGEGFVICYSIADRRSFEEAESYYRQIQRLRSNEISTIPVVLVGNKSDLQHARKVLKEEGQALALKFNSPFYETSAALKYHVEDVFFDLIRGIRCSRGECQASSSQVFKCNYPNSKILCIGRTKEQGITNTKRDGTAVLKRWRILRSVVTLIFSKGKRISE